MQTIKETGMRLLFALCACISILAVVLICIALSSIANVASSLFLQSLRQNHPQR